MKAKVLVIGSRGMAGHVIYNYLKNGNKFIMIDIEQNIPLTSRTQLLDISDKEQLQKFLMKLRPEIIINCSGILKRGSQINPLNAIYINSYIPHLLSFYASQFNGRIITLSTDCVFSGTKGNYSPEDPKDAHDLYGMSKSLGEIINDRDLTIRTSIIGPELKENGEGLFDWFFHQKERICGYSNVFWTGLTTLELAKSIEFGIINKIFGLWQLSNGIKISKYELLTILQQVWNKWDVRIDNDTSIRSDKSLIPSRLCIQYHVPDYKSMCQQLKLFMDKSSIYNKYNLSH